MMRVLSQLALAFGASLGRAIVTAVAQQRPKISTMNKQEAFKILGISLDKANTATLKELIESRGTKLCELNAPSLPEFKGSPYLQEKVKAAVRVAKDTLS